MMTVTGLFVVHGGSRNQPRRSFNRMIHSNKCGFFTRTDITQCPVMSWDIKILVAVWWLINGHMLIWHFYAKSLIQCPEINGFMLICHFYAKSLIQCPQGWRTLCTHLDTAQYAASHYSKHRLIPSIYLRHPGCGRRQLNICKLWHVHHNGVIN